jgi:hypothetical protein
MFSCLPFLYKPKGRSANAATAVKHVKVVKALTAVVTTEPVDEDPKNTFVEVPQVPQILRIRDIPNTLRIPDALMDIRNPSIKAELKKFCRENNLCIACSYLNPEKPTFLVYNGILYECPHCDSDIESP